MRIRGIIWIGAATEDLNESASFFSDVLGMEITTSVPGFIRLTTQNGDRVELFGPDSVEHDELDTGPVAGFWVEDLDEAHRELVEAGIDGVAEFHAQTDIDGSFLALRGAASMSCASTRILVRQRRDSPDRSLAGDGYRPLHE